MEFVPVQAPKERLPEVYDFLAGLIRGSDDAEAEAVEARQEAISPSPSRELVIRMYRESEPGKAHQKVMRHLATVAENEGDRRVPSHELMEVFGWSRDQLRGVFGAFGRRANHRYDGAKPWQAEWDRAAGEYGYWVSADVAAAIREAETTS